MTDAEFRAAKREVRARAGEAREALSAEERARAASAIEGHLFELPELGEAGTVLVFCSFGSEVSTEGIIRRLAKGGRRVALPRVLEGGIEARSYHPGDPVARAAFGALEPTGGEVVPPEALDVVLTPGLAFDQRGYRVGYGGGYFDRLLARTRREALRAGICFAVQVVQEVPAGPRDVPVDALVTERGVIRCRR